MIDNSAELVLKLQKGDKASFEVLFDLYKAKAVRTAYLITNNRALADDIVQETFILCYFKIADLKDPTSFKTWFFRMLTRLAWKMSVKEKVSIPVDNIFEFAEAEDTHLVEGEIIDKEESKWLMEAVEHLEIKKKITILLYYYNNFSVSEIAEIMGCFEGTVKSRLHAARKNLKKVSSVTITIEWRPNAVNSPEKFEDKLRKAIYAEANKICPSEDMFLQINRKIKSENMEVKNMKLKSMKKTRGILVACMLLAFTTITCFAAVKIVSYTSQSTNNTFAEFPSEKEVKKEAGFVPKYVNEFAEGYKFYKGGVGERKCRNRRWKCSNDSKNCRFQL